MSNKKWLLLLLSFWAFHARGQRCPELLLDDTVQACAGQTIRLNAAIHNPDNFRLLDTLWTPAAGLSDVHSLTPAVSVGTAPAAYTLTIRSVNGANLVANGDFSAGATGFTSDYTLNTVSLFAEGTYAVLTRPRQLHPAFGSFGDHTTGSGGMLVVNGAQVPDVSIWCQTIPVMPNTDYDFSTWGATCVSRSPAVLQFSINGELLSTPFNLPSDTGAWQLFHATWNSGSQTTATICITNQNIEENGNDFALDDIGFRSICTSEKTVQVAHHRLPLRADFGYEITADGCTNPTARFTDRSVRPPDAALQWFFGDGTSATGPDPLHRFPGAGKYRVQLVVTAADTCRLEVRDTVAREVSFDAALKAELPNAFSPNGDGQNDVLYVRGDCIAGIDLRIYDRWGHVVFRTTDPGQGWDGRMEGIPQEMDGYAYTLDITSVSGERVFKKGSVLLIR